MYTTKKPMPYHVAVLYNILWIIYIELHEDKPNNTFTTYLGLSYIDIMRFSLVN